MNKINLFSKNKHDRKFNLPSDIKRLLVFLVSLRSIYSIVRQVGAFMLTLATMMFSKNFGLALFFLIVFLLREPIFSTLDTIENQYVTSLQQKLQEFLASVKARVVSKTRDKIEVEMDGRKQKMSTSVILKTVEEYLERKNLVLYKSFAFIVDIIVFVISIISLVGIAASQTTNLPLFISILVISSILMILISAFLSNSRKKVWDKSKITYDNKENAERDVKEIEPISLKHITFLLNNIVKAQKNITEVNLKDRRKKNIEEIIRVVIISVALIIVDLVMLFTSKEGSITTTVFMTSIAFGQAFQSVIYSISSEISSLYSIINERREYKSKFEKDYVKIMEVFEREESIIEYYVSDDFLVVKPFCYSYSTTNFKLSLKDKCVLEREKVVLLNGKSGTGKSTFIKIISGEISTEAVKGKIKSIKYFNDTSMLGSRNLLEEITLEENVDEARLHEILVGVKLIERFKTIDELAKVSCKELSNGMLQRALLARALYNLEDADLVCVDEPIGSLDEENAKEVIAFVKEYCNRVKKRFIILCTHQHKFVSEYIDKVIYINTISALESEVKVD